MAQPDGSINPNGPVKDLSVPYGQTVAPVASTKGTLAGNLPSGNAATTSVQTATTMYDQQGVGHDVSYTFTKNSTDDWSLAVTVDGAPMTLSDSSVKFNPDGTMLNPAAPSTVDFTPGIAGGPGPVTLDLKGISQSGSPNTVSV